MKKLIMLFTVLLGVLSVSSKAYADSPVTSTFFSRAYYHVDIVEEASRRNKITPEMAAYLADENNPIDIKAAIINALSWYGEEGSKSNAKRYVQYIYGKELKDIDPTSLSGHQQFCIGYLLAMDDIYFSSTDSMDYLRMARDKMKDSLTVAIITFLVETMNNVHSNWNEQYSQIITDTSLTRDMSEAGVQEITNYMLLSIEVPVNIPKTGTTSMGLVYGIGAIGCFVVGVLGNRKRSNKNEVMS